jgi:tetratricopeptide (TPR) repeat protein
MGQAASTPQKPPPLSDDTDDSEEEDVLLLDDILKSGVANEEKEEEVSIVFFNEDEEEVDEKDLYYDERDADNDDFLCFGLPFFAMTSHFTAAAAATKLPSKKSKGDNDDEVEDPREGIESLQLELKVVDAIYNHTQKGGGKAESIREQKEEEEEVKEVRVDVDEGEGKRITEDEDQDEDEDPKENVESLQRELEEAEANYVPPEEQTRESDDCGGSTSSASIRTDGRRLQGTSSFIDLQQLFFSSGAEDDNSSLTKAGSVSSSATLFSSSSKSCRVVEIYETRTTQLKPLQESEKEKVPLERMGVPFRKCRNPSCSCHHPTTKTRDSSRRNRERNRIIIEKYHTNHGDDEENDDSSSFKSIRLKRRSTLQRLQKQREKLLAMDHDEDDQTEVTAGSLSSSSRYSGYSVRSDCQINTRMNYINNANQNPYRGHRRQRSLTEDFDERGRHASSSRGTRTGVSPSVLDPLPQGASATSHPSECLPSPTKPYSSSLIDSPRQNQTKQQPTPPPLPSRRSFGETNNHKHKTYPSLSQNSQSLRNIRTPSLLEDDTNGTPRRCRSEEFIDGSNSTFGCGNDRNGTGSNVTSSGGGRTSNDTGATSSKFREEHKSESMHVIQATIQIPESFDICGGKDKLNADGGIHRSMIETSVSKKLRGKRFVPSHTTSTTVHGSTAVSDQVENGESTKEEGEDKSFVRSPTCIMEEVRHNGSYPRSRTTQQEHEYLLKQIDRIHQQQQGSNSETGDPNTTSDAEFQTSVNRDERDDNPHRSRLFDERERSLKEYRQSIRILQNEEKMDRRQKIGSTDHTTLKRDSRKQQKWKRQKQQQREFKRTMQLADLYHNMGLIHYQQGRYDTARHVLQCGVDALIANRAAAVPFAQAALEEATDPFDDDYCNPYYASAPSRLLPVLPTLDEAAPHLSNQALLLAAELVLAQGKIFAAQGLWNETKQYSGKVLQWSAFQKQRLVGKPTSSHHRDSPLNATIADSNKYWKDWGPTTSRAQVLFARCFERERRPDIAMGYYQEALSVQRCVLGHGHVHTADTLYRIGNLHASAGLLGLAGQCYDEAMQLYRRHRSQTPNSAPPLLGEEDHRPPSAACIAADEATVLAGLGWIFFVQRDLARALALTNEALEGMVHALGSSHRNVLSLRHQLMCIQTSLAAAATATAIYPQHHHRPPVQALPNYDEKRLGAP